MRGRGRQERGRGRGRGGAVIYWKLLEQVQGANDALSESMVDERPVFLSGPPLQYPTLLRQAGIHGRVLVRAIIDTTGAPSLPRCG